MAKVIRTIIDSKGNVVVDFSGFVGDECAVQNARLHDGLAQLGLAVDERSVVRKRQDNTSVLCLWTGVGVNRAGSG
jgi:hypothetical protein